MRHRAWSFLLLLFLLESSELRQYDPCQLAQELAVPKHNVSFWQIPTWVCLASEASGLNSSYDSDGYHGIFRISGEHWGDQCNVTSDLLMDDYLEDDISCALHIYNNAKSSGFNAWGTYFARCREPWKHLENHDCHKFWQFLLLRLPKKQIIDDNDTTETFTVPSSTESSSKNKTEHGGFEVHHLLFSDAGLLIVILLLILIVAGLIEIWRRNEMPLSNLCL